MTLALVGCGDAERVSQLEKRVAEQEKLLQQSRAEATALRYQLEEAKKSREVSESPQGEAYEKLMALAKEHEERNPGQAGFLRKLEETRKAEIRKINELRQQEQSSRQSQPTESTAPSKEPRSDFGYPQAPIPPRPTADQIAKANSFFKAEDVISQKCKSEWPTDFQMQNYCTDKQRSAVRALDQGKPFGVDREKFNIIRVHCAEEWPQDFAMRLYCEGKQLKAIEAH